MSAISTILTRLRAAIWAIDVRDDIANAIEQCYSDVSNPTLQTEALEAALQNKIDQGEMAALTIGDGTITAVKLAQGVIDNTLATSGAAADAAETGRQIGLLKADLESVVAHNLGADATWTNGKAVQKSTGNVYSSSSASASGYIDISGCSSILYMRRILNATSAPTAGMAFYDSSKTFIADSGVTDGYKSGGGNPELHEEEVPEGAVYARFSYLRTDAETITDYPFELYDADAYRNATAQTAKEAKKSADDALTYIDGLIEAPSIAPLTGYNMEYDGYIASNGTSITSPTTAKERYTEYIPVESGALYVIDYKVKLETASNFWGQYCKYASDKAVVGSRTTLPTPTLEDDGYYHSYFEISIPSTTAYLRVTARTYGDAILTVYKYVDKSSEIQPSLQVMRKERAEEIAEAIESVSPSTTAIEAFPVVYSPNMYDYVCKGCNHRGYDTYQNYPENTMPAYQASKAHDFYFVETDVQVTSDEEFVLLHDSSINRTARNADGTTIEGTVNINSITLAQAKAYDFGIYQGSTWEGVQIPTLDEFLTYCKKACLHPYLEVKFDYSQTRVRAFVDKVLSHGLRNRVTYISGDTQALAEIASYDKTARIGIIYNEPSTAVIDTVLSLRTGCNEVFLDIKTASTDLISACVANHVPIELWTYDASNSGLLAKPEYVTGITHNKVHAGKLIHDSVVTE